MPRVTSDMVISVLGANWDGTTVMDPFITSGNLMTNQVVACAARKGIAIDDATLTEIERWLSAFSYTQNDPEYRARSTASASGQFRIAEEGNFLNQASLLDPSGCVNALFIKRNRAGARWLGKTVSEQLPFDQRN